MDKKSKKFKLELLSNETKTTTALLSPGVALPFRVSFYLTMSAEKAKHISKKQNRMYLNSFTINDDELNRLLKRFLRGTDDV